MSSSSSSCSSSHTPSTSCCASALVAKPFLVIGLIAVIRRILIITAEGERFAGEQFERLMPELGILTALVLALAAALCLLRPHQRADRDTQPAAVRAGCARGRPEHRA